MIPYNQFEKIINKQIFGNDKEDIFEKVSSYPQRFVGLFRPTKPKSKIFQNLLQSHEIRFGDAIEILFEKIIESEDFTLLEKRLTTKDRRTNEVQTLNIDLFFQKGPDIFMVEQKVRDDHDSTKKRGQIDNFEHKFMVVQELFPKNNLTGVIYFVDPDMTKNKNYYLYFKRGKIVHFG